LNKLIEYCVCLFLQLSFQHKVGVLYCKAGQSTEEEMYNNESAGPAMEEFLDLLGQRVRLKGFSKYRAQLDNKTDSTGTHSFYTTYKDYELMFHVSTLLPYTPNNRQQLLRKRHIGNDIVTIVFQEPGALPFTPKNIRSHFQHVFVIVKVHNPCTETVCYSVAVSRSKDVPPFGPPIPKGVTFPKSAVFRDFLLAKVINGENAAHKSEKFCAMATRTRQEYLKDLAENSVSTATVDSAVKFSFITLGAKRKERVKPRKDAHLHSVGAVTWSVMARDFGQSTDAECLLGISNEFIVLIEEESKNVVFNCSCRDVIGWTSSSTSIKVFYERGECVMLLAQSSCGLDIREIVQRLEIVSRGCETLEMTLRRNSLGQLGFHVNFEGIVADVEAFGFAWKAGLRQGSRLVEICKVAVATLTHEQMIDLLRTSVTVKVVIIQPYEDGAPRRGCSELYRIPMVEYKLDSEGTPCEYKTPFRRNTTWHRVPTTIAGQPLPRGSPTQCKERGKGQSALQHSQASIPRSTSFDRKLPDSSRYSHSLGSRCSSFIYLSILFILIVFCHFNLLSDGGDKNCSHSSSNTLSSSASSSNSDEKHFGSGDLMDPEMLGLTYIKGASTDSGIDTAPCCAPPPPPDMAATAAAHMVLHGQEIVEQESWTTEHQEDNGAEEELTKLRYSALPTRSPSARHSLYRTLSDESVCSNRKASSFSSSRSSMLDQAVPNDILFSSTRPYHSTLPPRISLSQPHPPHTPLKAPSNIIATTIANGGSHFSCASSLIKINKYSGLYSVKTEDEKEDKAILQVEVQHLRQDNMRLQEESQTAAAQLRKFTNWFFNTMDKKP
uniref:Signal induced proliferation associated 1 like 2 n=1 Tax=Astyanax mexicanus TaxID=7994 RepID=A0A8B9HFY5_ASTMX